MSRIRCGLTLMFGVLAFGLAVGCAKGTSRTATDGGAPVDFVGRQCNVDAECGQLRCDTVRHQCICLSDESCRGGADEPVRYCNNYTGLCVTEIVGCTDDSQCQSSEYCDASIRSCRARKAFCERCTQDSECGGSADNCIQEEGSDERFCSVACESSANCPRGAACVPVGSGTKQCRPGTADNTSTEKVTCQNFKGCMPDSLRSCSDSSECSAQDGQRCDLAQGRCVAIERICAFGTVCDPRSKICVAECSRDPDCGDPKLRCLNRLCEPIGECANDSECPANKVCSLAPGQTAGQCRPFCKTDPDCPIGNICQRGVDNKYRCVPGCSANSGCQINQRCNLAAKLCEGPVVGATKVCQATSVCDSCELCDPTQAQCFSAKATFPYCKPCSSPGECPGGTCVVMDDSAQYCAKYCGAGQECPQGFACLPVGNGAQSACVPSDRQCKDKCPTPG